MVVSRHSTAHVRVVSGVPQPGLPCPSSSTRSQGFYITHHHHVHKQQTAHNTPSPCTKYLSQHTKPTLPYSMPLFFSHHVPSARWPLPSGSARPTGAAATSSPASAVAVAAEGAAPVRSGGLKAVVSSSTLCSGGRTAERALAASRSDCSSGQQQRRARTHVVTACVCACLHHLHVTYKHQPSNASRARHMHAACSPGWAG